jgi:hypothetical protein
MEHSAVSIDLFHVKHMRISTAVTPKGSLDCNSQASESHSLSIT